MARIGENNPSLTPEQSKNLADEMRKIKIKREPTAPPQKKPETVDELNQTQDFEISPEFTEDLKEVRAIKKDVADLETKHADAEKRYKSKKNKADLEEMVEIRRKLIETKDNLKMKEFEMKEKHGI